MCVCYLYTTIVFIHTLISFYLFSIYFCYFIFVLFQIIKIICNKVLVHNNNIGFYVTLKQNLRALYRHNNWPHILDLCACVIVLETIWKLKNYFTAFFLSSSTFSPLPSLLCTVKVKESARLQNGSGWSFRLEETSWVKEQPELNISDLRAYII